MPTADRRARIRAAVAELRERSQFALDADLDSPLSIALSSASIPEIFAIVIHLARAEDADETERVEVMLRAMQPPASSQELASWCATLEPLGYTSVSRMIRRLCRSAPSRPPTSIFDKAKTRQAARKAELAKAGDTIN